jgi:RNA polymerase-interacting CarD/CdnL/TRCF family regulator
MGQEPSTFAKLYFERDGLSLMMRPQDLEENVRQIISDKEAKEVLKHLESCDDAMSAQWKTRTNRNESIIENGDPYELARVYKGLARMQSDGQSLRAADRKHLQTAFEFLSDELAAALGKSENQVKRMINERCGLPES